MKLKLPPDKSPNKSPNKSEQRARSNTRRVLKNVTRIEQPGRKRSPGNGQEV